MKPNMKLNGLNGLKKNEKFIVQRIFFRQLIKKNLKLMLKHLLKIHLKSRSKNMKT